MWTVSEWVDTLCMALLPSRDTSIATSWKIERLAKLPQTSGLLSLFIFELIIERELLNNQSNTTQC